MRYPTLNELPPPPPGKIGWPWTEESLPLSPAKLGGQPWPRISVVTPSFNQGQFIEETIRSILLQGYPNLEYIIIDGGSKDNSIDIIRKYETWISYWVSEPDHGQAHAINKGFERCTGDLIGWVNSDDLLLPGAAYHLAQAFKQKPDTLLMGDVLSLHESYGFRRLIRQENVTLARFVQPWRYKGNTYCHQLGVYVPRSLNQQIGILDESLRYTFDWDWICRLLQLAPVYYLRVPIAQFRYHNESKTVGEAPNWFQEKVIVIERYGKKVKGFDRDLTRAAFGLENASMYLSLHRWNRDKGKKYLKQSLQQDWRACMLPGFTSLCIKAITPFFLLQVVRRIYHNLLKAKSPASQNLSDILSNYHLKNR